MPRRLIARVATLILAVGLCGTGSLHAQATARRRIAETAPIVETPSAHAGTNVRAAVRVQLPSGYHVNSDHPRDPALLPLTMTVESPQGVSLVDLAFPTPSDLVQQGSLEPLSVFEHTFVIGARLRLEATVADGPLVVPVRLRYQACDATRCYLPATAETSWTWSIVAGSTPTGDPNDEPFRGMTFRPPAARLRADDARAPRDASATVAPSRDPAIALDRFTVAGTDGGYMGAAAFTAFLRRAERGEPARRPFEGRGTMAILLLVLAGGLALNLTPCVLPMIPANLAIIGAGTRAGSRARGWIIGSAYGAAMALVYGVLGVIVILTAQTFGTINASPWFNAAVAVLFVALALSMFDVFFIDLSRYSTRLTGKGARGSLLLAFGMGGVAALLAGACVAPVVIQVVLFSTELYASGHRSALMLPFVLGVGMAAPWPIAGAGLAALPRPGAWMVRVKQAFGVVMVAMAGYYAYIAYTSFADRLVDRDAVASSANRQVENGWFASLADGLDAARREGKPVLIDLWATWCKNCLVMDRTTLADPGVKAAIDGYVKIKFQAEDPEDQVVRDVMQRFHAVGLPAYVVLKPAT